MSILVFIDFEFNQTKDEHVNIVCCSYSVDDIKYEYWHDELNSLKEDLEGMIENGCIFVAYSVVAEARCFRALGINPVKVQWVDLFLEYRCLLNHSTLQYGKHLIDGKVHRNPPHRFDNGFQKPSDGLASACYKLLNIKIDTGHKDFMRDVVIDGRYVNKYRDAIQQYCTSDIKHLPNLLDAIVKEYAKRLPKFQISLLKSEMYYRGEFAARTAVMESIGHPIDLDATKNFSKSVTDILNDVAEDINNQFPEIKPFELNRATRKYVFKQSKAKEQIKKWCEKHNKDWDRSKKTNEYSLAVDAYSKHFNYRHDFPRNNYFAQVLRYKKTEQHMNGFKPKKKAVNCWPGTDILKMSDPTNKRRKNFFDAVGSDGRVRPYFNIYGSQSSRSQPPATTYLFLKAAWMRSLCVPPTGKAIVGIDYGQQELYVKALLSQDTNMIKAYVSGDVYLHTGKLVGAIPKDGTKKTHGHLRDLFKSTTLGIQFGMSKIGLATKLTNDTGKETSEDDAQSLIDQFYEAYPNALEHDEYIMENYTGNEYLKLPDGWYMFGENPNERSVKNCPVQGLGACIMRRAICIAQDKGLNVVITLHDALYIECDLASVKQNAVLLADCMDEAFNTFFPNQDVHIRLDADIWSKELSNAEYDLEYSRGKLPVKQQNVYIDERSASEYERFKEYFVDRYRTDLL